MRTLQIRSLPPHVIYEDERLFVMLDRQGLAFGHVMVIPRGHDEKIYAMNEADYANLLGTSRKFARLLQESLHPTAVSYVAHGAGIPHVHLHLVPLTERDEITDPTKYMRNLSDAQLAEEAEKLCAMLPANLESILSSDDG